MFYMRYPALALVFLCFLLLGWGVAIADTEPKMEDVQKSVDQCGKYVRLITDEMLEEWKKIAPYTAGRVTTIVDVWYTDEQGIDQRAEFISGEANGIMVGQYFLTVSHVVKDVSMETIAAWLTQMKNVRQYSNLRIKPPQLKLTFPGLEVGGRDLVDTSQEPIIDKELHFVLLKLRVSLPDFYSTSLSFGKTQEILGYGKGVVLMGNPMGLGTEFRSGDVSNERPAYKTDEVTKQFFEPIREGIFFSTSIPAYPGDSGGLVIAFDACGKPIAVGIAFSYIRGNTNAWLVVLRSEAIYAFLKNNGLDVSKFYAKHLTP